MGRDGWIVEFWFDSLMLSRKERSKEVELTEVDEWERDIPEWWLDKFLVPFDEELSGVQLEEVKPRGGVVEVVLEVIDEG